MSVASVIDVDGIVEPVRYGSHLGADESNTTLQPLSNALCNNRAQRCDSKRKTIAAPIDDLDKQSHRS